MDIRTGVSEGKEVELDGQVNGVRADKQVLLQHLDWFSSNPETERETDKEKKG